MAEDPGVELAKAATQGAVAGALEPVAEFVSAIAGAPTKEASNWLADIIRARRFRTQIKILQRAQEQLAAAGLSPHAVDYKILVPLIEAASLEDEDDATLVNAWASLLANAASDATRVTAAFTRVLADLSALDAQIADALYRHEVPVTVPPPETIGLRPHITVSGVRRRFAGVDVDLALYNLERLGVIEFGLTYDALDVNQRLDPNRPLALTPFGRAFVNACSPP